MGKVRQSFWDRNPLDPLREAKIALHFLEKEEAAPPPINTHQMHLGEHTPKEKREGQC